MDSLVRVSKAISGTLSIFRHHLGNYLFGMTVFEIQVKNKSSLKILENELLTILKPKEDSLRFYNLCQNCVEKSWSLGEELAPFEKNNIYFI